MFNTGNFNFTWKFDLIEKHCCLETLKSDNIQSGLGVVKHIKKPSSRKYYFI